MIVSFSVLAFLSNAQAKPIGDSCLQIPSSLSKANGNELKIESACDLAHFKLDIYNRWGSLMYSADEYKASYDLNVDEKTGKKKQIEKFEPGVYFWVIAYEADDDLGKRSLTGSITIL